MCNICNKTFPRHSSLELHFSSVHEKLKSKCNICGKEVSTSNIKTHIEAMHGERKNFKCEVCSKEFRTNRYVANHMTIVHKQEKFPV